MTDTPKTDEKKSDESRIDQIREAASTPRGFFALIVLAVEAVFGVLAARVENSTTQIVLIIGMLVLALVLAGIVAYEWLRPKPTDDAHQSTPIALTQILCAATTQFEQLDFDGDIAVLNTEFAGKVSVQRHLTSQTLTERLTTEKFQVVHLLSYINRETGSVCFDEDNHDQMSAQGLKSLLDTCDAKLVFLATCDSVFLAAQLASRFNVVAAHGSVDAAKLVAWEKCFYRLLAKGRPLSHAYDVASATSDIPVVLLLKNDMVLA